MAAETKEEQQNHKVIPQGEQSNKAPCGNHGFPQPGSRDHMAQPSGHNSSHIVTSKQTTTEPCRNESGGKKDETDSET